MANLITLTRFLLLFLLVAMAYWSPPAWQLLNAPMLLFIIALDGVDGWVARRRNETSAFGSVFDIAVDRVVENVLWIVLGNLGLIPIWVAIVFIARGALVDSIRYAAVARGIGVFETVHTRLARILVAGRTMRGLYGAVKAATFGWVLLLQPLPQLVPEMWSAWQASLQVLTMVLVYASVALCLVRGLPVVAQFVAEAKPFERAHITAGSH